MDNGAPVRLSRQMALMGICSRREADDYIARGLVKVNGETAVVGQKVTHRDNISFSPEVRKAQERRVTVIMHKPLGYVSGQAEDGYKPARVLVTPRNRWQDDRSNTKYDRSHLKGLVPAGRLDINSTGLLILTQDGTVARNIISDYGDVDKEYLVRVSGHLSKEGLRLLNHGLSLDGEKLRPAEVTWQNRDQLRFVLRQGKKRQIRRMCALVGLKVVALKRVRVGKIRLGGLPVGKWRYLRDDEVI